jgi:hypothetical protein
VVCLALAALSPWHKLKALALVLRNFSVNLGKRLLISNGKPNVQ